MRGQATLTKDEAEKLVQSACAAMSAELARLRADLAEARADVQRFEAALDASQRELAEAERKLAVSETLRAAASRSGNEVAKSTLDYYAMEKRKARTWEERALKAEAALDVSQRELAEARKDIATLARSYLKPYARALKQDPDDGGYSATIIEFAGCYSEGETRDEALANIEEAATGWMLAALSMGQTIPEPMKYRRTILALVVFGRSAWRSLRTLAGNQARWQMAQLGVKVNMLLISERSKTTHD